jgi:hypothetical protein
LAAALLSHAKPAAQVPVEDKLPLPQSSDPTHGMPALPQVPAAVACYP